MSKYNEYVKAAKHPASGSSPEEMAAGAVDANTMATLAVAEQLRIANLIALATTVPDDRDGNGQAVDDMRTAACDALARYASHEGAARGYYLLRPDIADALGIKEATND